MSSPTDSICSGGGGTAVGSGKDDDGKIDGGDDDDGISDG
ncbi:hypothetical protein Tco_1379813, partial [Tanacetum coccineum]